MSKNDTAAIKAQKASIISSFITLSNAVNETDLDTKDGETRSAVAEYLDEMLFDFSDNNHTLKWKDVCNDLHYDVYLAKKEVTDGSVTSFDLIRPGLVKAQFSHEDAYKEHKARVDENKQTSFEMKTCSDCGLSKLTNKFTRAGGAVCNSCRMKQYRQRKAARND